MVGGGWWLVIGGWWHWEWLAIGGWSPLAVGSGWLAVGGWRLVVPWDGPQGRSLTKKNSRNLVRKGPLLPTSGVCCGIAFLTLSLEFSTPRKKERKTERNRCQLCAPNEPVAEAPGGRLCETGVAFCRLCPHCPLQFQSSMNFGSQSSPTKIHPKRTPLDIVAGTFRHLRDSPAYIRFFDRNDGFVHLMPHTSAHAFRGCTPSPTQTSWSVKGVVAPAAHVHTHDNSGHCGPDATHVVE